MNGAARPALNHGPRKVAALTEDMDVISINITDIA